MDGCEGNAAPYALGALPPDERDRFERHLEHCSVCRDELDSLQVAADHLAAEGAPPARAPKAVRRRVLAQVYEKEERRPRVALALSFALVAVLLVIVVVRSGPNGGQPPRTLSAQVRPPGSHVLVRVGSGRTEISIAGMPQPGTGRIYEVWTKSGAGAPKPTSALFGVTRSGEATTAIPIEARSGSEVLISSEPLGGSSSPTRTPIVVARL